MVSGASRIVDRVNAYQESDLGLPITCGNDRRHPPPVCTDEAPHELQLACRVCGYRMPLTHGLYEAIAEVMRGGPFHPSVLRAHLDRARPKGFTPQG